MEQFDIIEIINIFNSGRDSECMKCAYIHRCVPTGVVCISVCDWKIETMSRRNWKTGDFVYRFQHFINDVHLLDLLKFGTRQLTFNIGLPVLRLTSRRFTGSPVHQFTGSATGSPVHRFSGSTVRRFGGSLVLRFGGSQDLAGAVLRRFAGAAVQRFGGPDQPVRTSGSNLARTKAARACRFELEFAGSATGSPVRPPMQYAKTLKHVSKTCN